MKHGHPDMSVRRQCVLLSLSRSSLYYQPRGESTGNLRFMEIIDKQFLETPWYGSRQMARHMQREGHKCGRHRVRRLMKLMRLVPIYQEPKTSKKHPAHKIYPYLLRDLPITRPNQAWCTDINYIPMRRGFLYLVAIMDWYSRKVLSWRLTADQITEVLVLAGQDNSPLGLRDHAILQLLAKYGLRSGEVGRLQIEDINWRADTIRVHRSKSNATAVLPLMESVGEAILRYLRDGRPDTDMRTVFVRSRAPYQPMTASSLYGVVKRRLGVAGIELTGKRGPHIFRHARAVSMLRASTPRKIIGDVLGHRSPESTAPYLKLATEDLRAIAINLPGREVRQ